MPAINVSLSLRQAILIRLGLERLCKDALRKASEVEKDAKYKIYQPGVEQLYYQDARELGELIEMFKDRIGPMPTQTTKR